MIMVAQSAIIASESAIAAPVSWAVVNTVFMANVSHSARMFTEQQPVGGPVG